MFNVNELNEYVNNFGAVIKKLNKIGEINDKVENVSEAQKETDRAMRAEWEKTIPLMDAQICELKDMVAQIEQIAIKEENTVKSMDNSIINMQQSLNQNLENTLQTIDLKFESQKKELQELQNSINTAITNNLKQQQEEMEVKNEKISKLQITVLVAVIAGIILDIVLKLV